MYLENQVMILESIFLVRKELTNAKTTLEGREILTRLYNLYAQLDPLLLATSLAEETKKVA